MKVYHCGKRTCVRGTIREKFDFYSGRSEAGHCWLWKSNLTRDGHGLVRDGRQMKHAHRVSWELHHGPIPEGMHVLHKCNNPACVNPGHLKLGNHLANMSDRREAGHYPENERHPNCKFSNEVVAHIRASKEKRNVLARRFGVSESQVTNIRFGRQRRATEMAKAGEAVA